MSAAGTVQRAIASVKARHERMIANHPPHIQASIRKIGPDYVPLPVATLEALLAELAECKRQLEGIPA